MKGQQLGAQTTRSKQKGKHGIKANQIYILDKQADNHSHLGAARCIENVLTKQSILGYHESFLMNILQPDPHTKGTARLNSVLSPNQLGRL